MAEHKGQECAPHPSLPRIGLDAVVVGAAFKRQLLQATTNFTGAKIVGLVDSVVGEASEASSDPPSRGKLRRLLLQQAAAMCQDTTDPDVLVPRRADVPEVIHNTKEVCSAVAQHVRASGGDQASGVVFVDMSQPDCFRLVIQRKDGMVHVERVDMRSNDPNLVRAVTMELVAGLATLPPLTAVDVASVFVVDMTRLGAAGSVESQGATRVAIDLVVGEARDASRSAGTVMAVDLDNVALPSEVTSSQMYHTTNLAKGSSGAGDRSMQQQSSFSRQVLLRREEALSTCIDGVCHAARVDDEHSFCLCVAFSSSPQVATVFQQRMRLLAQPFRFLPLLGSGDVSVVDDGTCVRSSNPAEGWRTIAMDPPITSGLHAVDFVLTHAPSADEIDKKGIVIGLVDDTYDFSAQDTRIGSASTTKPPPMVAAFSTTGGGYAVGPHGARTPLKMSRPLRSGDIMSILVDMRPGQQPFAALFRRKPGTTERSLVCVLHHRLPRGPAFRLAVSLRRPTDSVWVLPTRLSSQFAVPSLFPERHCSWALVPAPVNPPSLRCAAGNTARQLYGNVWNSLPWRVVTTNGYSGGDGGDDGGGAASLDGSMCRGAGPRHEYYWEVEFVAIANKNLSVGVLDCGDTVETAVARCTAASTTHVHSNGAFNGSPMLEFGSSKVYFGNTRARPIALPNGGNLVGWRLGLLLDLNENSEACGTLSAVFVRYEDLASGAAVTPAETLELGVVASGLCSRLYRPVVSIHHVNNCVRVVSRRQEDLPRAVSA